MTGSSYSGAGQTVARGETIELDDSEALRLVALGVAEVVEPVLAPDAPAELPRGRRHAKV